LRSNRRESLWYYRVGKHAEALAALEKSLSGNASDGVEAIDLYFLTICHYRLGDKAKAVECFERAMELHERNAARLPKERLEELKQHRTEAKTLLVRPAEKR
jgi:tetratricopeptide (TPR) repeat protein